jgi:hypothetical protein
MLPDLTAQTADILPFQGVCAARTLLFLTARGPREATENAKKARARQACTARGRNAVASG